MTMRYTHHLVQVSNQLPQQLRRLNAKKRVHLRFENPSANPVMLGFDSVPSTDGTEGLFIPAAIGAIPGIVEWSSGYAPDNENIFLIGTPAGSATLQNVRVIEGYDI
jgi:hypothetical protein